jgi:hypothetical protein
MTADYTVMKTISREFSEQLNYFLDKAIQDDKADMGNIQLFCARTEISTIVAQKGFKSDFLEYFKTVKAFDTSACGRAIGHGNPVLIGNIMLDIAYLPHRDIAISAGYKAVKSVPILSENQKFLGVISIHYKATKWNWDLNATSDIVKSLAELLQKQMVKTV